MEEMIKQYKNEIQLLTNKINLLKETGLVDSAEKLILNKELVKLQAQEGMLNYIFNIRYNEKFLGRRVNNTDISKFMGLSKERIRQIINEAISKLRIVTTKKRFSRYKLNEEVK